MMIKKSEIKVIAFDADDTLWVNETLFRAAELKFCEMMEDFLPQHTAARELLAVEIQNLADYGYGIKSFMLSMIEAAMKISNQKMDIKGIARIIEIGKSMIRHPVEIIEGVEEVLKNLQGKYRLVVVTKGDLLDQERKLRLSGLEPYFHHIEIVSEKNEPEYLKLIRHLDIAPANFAMVGNSLKSDILPVLEIGAYGFHVPFHVTWALEQVEKHIQHPHFIQLKTIRDLLAYV